MRLVLLYIIYRDILFALAQRCDSEMKSGNILFIC